MVKHAALAALAAHVVGLAVAAGTTEWDGSFNAMTTATLEEWSWSNQVGAYQWYIFGTGTTTDYVDFDAAYANPDDATSTKGAKITLTSTSFWNGQTMRRTELIPQTSDTSAITSGTVYYHFSMKREDTNAPSVEREHQIAFFESHFTEMKYGLASGAAGAGDTTLSWFANSAAEWNATLEAGVWHNCVYEIDFDASTVGFWHSTGGDELTQVVAPVSASVSSNGADWHVGVLELPVDGVADTDEDLYFSGVYIQSGELTTAIGSGSGSDSGSADDADSRSGSSAVASSAVASTYGVVASSAPVVAAVTRPASGYEASAVAPSAAASATSSPDADDEKDDNDEDKTCDEDDETPASTVAADIPAATTAASPADKEDYEDDGTCDDDDGDDDKAGPASSAPAVSNKAALAVATEPALNTYAEAPTSAAAVPTLAATSPGCVPSTKTVYVTMAGGY